MSYATKLLAVVLVCLAGFTMGQARQVATAEARIDATMERLAAERAVTMARLAAERAVTAARVQARRAAPAARVQARRAAPAARLCKGA